MEYFDFTVHPRHLPLGLGLHGGGRLFGFTDSCNNRLRCLSSAVKRTTILKSITFLEDHHKHALAIMYVCVDH
jgi:hypothetical protein